LFVYGAPCLLLACFWIPTYEQ